MKKSEKFALWFLMSIVVGCGIGLLSGNLVYGAGIGAGIGIVLGALFQSLPDKSQKTA